MLTAIAKLLRLAAVLMCLVTTASFALYAINQTDSASARQQETLSVGSGASSAPPPSSPIQTSEPHTTGVRGVIDEVSKTLTSPFESATASSNSEWVKRGVNLAIALAVYGFALGFLARFLRVRA
jgi:hypothetical protein